MPEGMNEQTAQIVTEDEKKEEMVPLSELRKVNAEAARYRKALQALEAKIEEDNKNRERARMDELQRLNAEKAEAEMIAGRFRQIAEHMAKRSAVIDAATRVGFRSPQDAFSLIDVSQIELNSDLEPDKDKVMELVKELAQEKPYLLNKGVEPGNVQSFGPSNPPPGQQQWPRPKLTTANQIEQLKQQARELTRQGRVREATRLFNIAWETEHPLPGKGG